MNVVVRLPGELEEGGGRDDGAWLAKIKIRKEVLEMVGLRREPFVWYCVKKYRKEPKMNTNHII